MAATAVTRVNLAMPHLLAAARYSRMVKAVEDANAGSPLADWWDEMRDHAVSCFFLTSACLESYANELFNDSAKIFPGDPSRLIDKIWEMAERKNPLEKLALALDLRSRPSFVKNDPVYKAMVATIRLRNELTHFKPEWSHEADKHVKISDVLAPYLTPNPIMPDPYIFPRAWVSHNSTVWAVNTTIDFIEYFEKQADLVGRTERAKWGVRLAP